MELQAPDPQSIPKSRWSSRSGRSKQDAIYLELRRRLSAGHFPLESFLPSMRELAESFQSSITPVRLALQRLEEQGYLITLHGAGVRVVSTHGRQTEVASKPLVEVLTTVTDVMGGGRPSSRSHRLMAIQEYLLWKLTGQEDIRLCLATVHSNYTPDLILSRLRDAMHEKPDVLVVPMAEIVDEKSSMLFRQLRAQGTHVVYNAARHWVPEFDKVISDFAHGQYLLTRKLWEDGCRRIVRFSAGNQLFYYESQKQEGFARALMEEGFSAEEIEKHTVQHRPSLQPEQHLAELLSILPAVLDRCQPDAICAYADMPTALLRAALEMLGQKDIRLSGYDATWNEVEWSGKLGWLYAANKGRLGPEYAPLSVDAHLPEVGAALAEMALARALRTLPSEPQEQRIAQTLFVPGHVGEKLARADSGIYTQEA